MSHYLSASLLSADLARLADAVHLVQDSVDYIHCDVMDGHFVPNLTFGAPVIAALKKVSHKPLDVHLMIAEPGRWVERYLATGLDGADFLTFHIEAEADPESVLRRIHNAGVKSGIAIKPNTPWQDATRLFPLVDQILIMTVEPGFGGQSFRHDMMPKLRGVRAATIAGQVIAVDGGIDAGTAPVAAAAGANLFVAGKAIFGAPDPLDAISRLRAALIHHLAG
jgi:ribulose-phosphate 3-epimerase